VPDVQLDQDQILSRLLAAENNAADSLTLVPSENRLSAFASLPFILDSYNRYFFNTTLSEDEWLFPGGVDFGAIETEVTLPLARELLNAPFINVRPLSGLSAMILTLSALGGSSGEPVLHLNEDQGGHYATASIIDRLGLRPIAISGISPNSIDLDRLSHTIASENPLLLYIDQANAIFPIQIKEICEAARTSKPNILIHVDISHWMGLILGRHMPNPLDLGADSIGGSTHKSFPGPQKGLLATRRKDLDRRFADSQFYLISSHHLAASISLGLALWEFREYEGDRYAAEIINNARHLGVALNERGFYVHGEEVGFTKTHQLWVQTEPLGIPTRVAAERLRRNGLRVNFLPNLPGLSTPTLRLGLSEITRLGLEPSHMIVLADLMASSVKPFHHQQRAAVKHLIAMGCRRYTAPLTESDLSRFLACSEEVLASDSTPSPRFGERPHSVRTHH